MEIGLLGKILGKSNNKIDLKELVRKAIVAVLVLRRQIFRQLPLRSVQTPTKVRNSNSRASPCEY